MAVDRWLKWLVDRAETPIGADSWVMWMHPNVILPQISCPALLTQSHTGVLGFMLLTFWRCYGLRRMVGSGNEHARHPSGIQW